MCKGIKHMNSDILKINNFTLSSTDEVPGVMNEIELLVKDKVLIHVVSYIYNSVLVQRLIREINKRVPDAKIVFLKHDDKQKTSVVIFTIDTDETEHISDEILKELYKDLANKKLSMQEYRIELFKRYFTDHLTNLPNLYQLRKDLENCDKCSLILVKIDNFQMLNNFYGFVVGDYVLEYVGKYLKKVLAPNQVYRLSGAEFAITLEEHFGFYHLKDYLSEIYGKIKNIKVDYEGTEIFVDFTLASSSERINNNIFSKVSMSLKYAKEKGVPFWIYEDKMNFEDEYHRNLQLSSVVRKAVENDRIIPYFQAIRDNKTKKIRKIYFLISLKKLFAEHHESPGTKAYTNKELLRVFAMFRNVHLYNIVTPYDLRISKNSYLPSFFKN